MEQALNWGGTGRWGALVLCALMLTACAETQFLAATAKRVSRVAEPPGPITSKGVYKVGNPYQIEGTWYYPAVDYQYSETGIASWYGPQFHGRDTANGERFDMNMLTAAHRTLPLPSFVRVTNLDNGRSLVLRVNDRGPFARGRIIDVSRRAAQLLGFEVQGTARVEVAILAKESQAIAARMQGGGTQVVSADSPLTVERLPTVAVSSETLPPPPGAKAAADRPVRALPGSQPATPQTPAAIETQDIPNPVVGVVSTVPPQVTQIYVQAGAYGVYQNAYRTQAMLSGIGNVDISQVLVDNRDLYRVRVGPIGNVDQADAILEQVIGAGYNDARIIVVD